MNGLALAEHIVGWEKKSWCEEKPNFHSISANNIIEEDQLSGALLLLGTVFPFQLWLPTLVFLKNGKRTINLQAAYVFNPNTIDTICMTHTMSETTANSNCFIKRPSCRG